MIRVQVWTCGHYIILTQLNDHFRYTRIERSDTSGKLTGSSARHARPTHQKPTSRPTCTVWSTSADVTPFEKRARLPDRSYIFPEDHWQHTNGKGLM